MAPTSPGPRALDTCRPAKPVPGRGPFSSQHGARSDITQVATEVRNACAPLQRRLKYRHILLTLPRHRMAREFLPVPLYSRKRAVLANSLQAELLRFTLFGNADADPGHTGSSQYAVNPTKNQPGLESVQRSI